jgi:aldehyde:ferredoxin oxidoreductase
MHLPRYHPPGNDGHWRKGVHPSQGIYDKEGLTRKDDVLPERFFTEPIPEGPDKGAVLSRKEVEDTLDEYYELRGWDKATGLPTL